MQLPEKLSPMIVPLMKSLKSEAEAQMQSMSASALALLLALSADREPWPGTKVLQNLLK